MREIEIKENDANQRLDKFIQKSLPLIPKNLMYKFIRNKKIKVNGKRAQINQRLQVGDVLTCYIAEEFFESKNDDTFLRCNLKLDVIYEDDNLVIMNKTSGVLSQSDINESVDTLVNALKKYLYEKKEYDYHNEQSFKPAIANRLDKNTSGLVIGCKNAQALREMNNIIKEHLVHKYYYGIVEGDILRKACFEDFHIKQDQKIIISDEAKEGYKPIKTCYEEILSKNSYHLLKIELFTGKMHQIRAQLAYHQLPLLGDIKYGGRKFGKNYQLLEAVCLKFDTIDDGLFQYLSNKEIKLKNSEVEKVFNQLK